MTVFDKAARIGFSLGESFSRRNNAGKIWGSGLRECSIIDQKRDSPLISGKGGIDSSVEVASGGNGDDEEVDCLLSEVESLLLLWATSSDARETGSPIVVSLASFDSDGRLESCPPFFDGC